MSQPEFKDLFSKQSDYYSKARPSYPEELFQYLSSLCKEHERAWDCATGNGQAAVSLTPYFDEVIATDASESQLKSAYAHAQIKYYQAVAEESKLPNHSVDLITVATAIHWFNLDKFYAEVKRVLKPDGILACWAYWWCDFSPSINGIMMKLADDILGEYWNEGRKLVNDKYETLYFPFQQLPTPHFQTATHWNLEQYKMYLRTWSSTQKYIDKHGTNPIELIDKELAKAWGDKDLVREGKWDIFMKVARF